MRICVLQSSYEGTVHTLEEVDDDCMDPGPFTTQHEFENRFIRKATAKADIDAAVAEGFDFYFNFMWGTYDDGVPGVAESEYFESLKVPHIGILSSERKMSKHDFFAEAMRRGAPPVPSSDKFPLFVKPANGCSSMFIDEKSVCHDEKELEKQIKVLDGKMRSMRIQRAKGLGFKDIEAYADSCERAGRYSTDLVVQEFIQGMDYAVDVMAMGSVPVPLSPRVVKYKPLDGKEQFLTFDGKSDPTTSYGILRKEDNPMLFQRLQKAAVEAFITNKMHENGMGCDVDLRATADNKVFVVEINPMPVGFYPMDSHVADVDIQTDLPGKFEAAINIFITNYYLKHPGAKAARSKKIGENYDTVAPEYDCIEPTEAGLLPIDVEVLQQFSFEGNVLDLCCGTGIVGRTLSDMQSRGSSSPSSSSSNSSTTTAQKHPLAKVDVKRLIGVDISNGMLDVCRQTELYDETHQERIQDFLGHYNEHVDHIVCLTGLQYLPVEELYFVLARFFQLARRSITLTIDEIPEIYNEAMRRKNMPEMCCLNHIEHMKVFGEPTGWRLVYLRYHWAWQSPTSGVEVYTNYIRFERRESPVLLN